MRRDRSMPVARIDIVVLDQLFGKKHRNNVICYTRYSGYFFKQKISRKLIT